jgi:hypothetical protein
LAKPVVACSESARLTASIASPELARPTSQLARPTASTAIVPASAQVGLADFIGSGNCRCIFNDLAPIVDHSLKVKSNIIQIKDVPFSTMINNVENINILLKSQLGDRLRMTFYLLMIK